VKISSSSFVRSVRRRPSPPLHGVHLLFGHLRTFDKMSNSTVNRTILKVKVSRNPRPAIARSLWVPRCRERCSAMAQRGRGELCGTLCIVVCFAFVCICSFVVLQNMADITLSPIETRANLQTMKISLVVVWSSSECSRSLRRSNAAVRSLLV
jgi:hypothetical protein